MDLSFFLGAAVGVILGIVIAYFRFRTIERGGREDKD